MKKKKKTISISSRKAKARVLQNWIAEQISKLFDIPWGGTEDFLIEPRKMGQPGVDVILKGEVAKKFPFSIEAKNCEAWRVQGDIEQAKKNEKKNTFWLLFYKKNNAKPVVLLDAEVFFGLFGVLEEHDI